jgi:hypothetical protein
MRIEPVERRRIHPLDLYTETATALEQQQVGFAIPTHALCGHKSGHSESIVLEHERHVYV